MVGSVPLPRQPLGTPGPPDGPDTVVRRWAAARLWYENDLGWAIVPGPPGQPFWLVTGVRFDVLDVPAEAGAGALRHLAPGSPVALHGDRMRLLVAAGSAEELPGLLDWLEWSALALDLRVLGAGGLMEAPAPPGPLSPGPAFTGSEASLPERSAAGDRAESVQGAAVWLRPPEPGCAAEASLPALSALGGVGRVGCAPDLVRLVDTVAAQCHRVRLRRACAGSSAGRRNQPLAFS
ncbi:SCO3374 family protein [Streptomyces sp. NPDC002676]